MARSAPPAEPSVTLGRIVGMFGVRGALKVQSHTEPPEALLNYRDWQLVRPHTQMSCRVVEGRLHGRSLVVTLEQISDREVARSLIGADIQVPRSALPELDAQEHYQIDLIGLRVVNEQDEVLGRLTHFVETDAHPIMVIQSADKTAEGRPAEHWVPAVRKHLINVDMAAGEIRVDWPLD
jgi:16S rRNA processing protein RimM